MISIEEEEKKPKTKPEVDRGSSGKPPRPTAVGMADGGDDDENFNKDQIVLCKIIGTDPRGFKVLILGSNVEACLSTNEHFQLGRSVRAKFTYWSESGEPILQPATRQEAKMFLHRDAPTFQSAPESMYDAMLGNDPNYRYEPSLDPPVNRKRPNTVSKTLKTPFGNIFARSVIQGPAYPFAAPESFQRKRTLDMFIAPIGSSEYIQYDIDSNNSLRDRLLEFQDDKFTGCIIVENNTFFSRGGILLYKGNCVGAIYSNNFEQNTDDTESAMRSLLMELHSPPASFIWYSLLDAILLPYSALLVGRTLEDVHNLNCRELIDKFAEEQLTGVIALQSAANGETIFVMIYDGEPSSFFMVQKRLFSFDTKKQLDEVLTEIDISSISAAILPEEEFIQTQFNPIDYLPGDW